MSLNIKLRSLVRRKLTETVPTQHTDTSYSSSGAHHSAAFRERLKQDPVKWNNFKLQEAERSRQIRQKRTDEQKIKQREQARIRQQRFAAKRKLLGLKEEKKPKPSKILTRNEAEKKREYNRLKKRESRERMNPQQRRRAREKEAQRRRENREKIRRRKPTNKQDNIIHNQCLPYESPGYRTDSARRMAISRMWSKIPKDPEKFADIITDLISGRKTTPRKKAALSARGIQASCRRRMNFHDELKKKLSLSLNELKQKRDTISLRNRRLLMTSLLISRKYRLSRELNVRPGYISKLTKEIKKSGKVETDRKARKDKTCLDVVQNIQSFYQMPRISRELPCMKTIKNQKQKFIMEVSVQRAYTMWKAENPELNIVSSSVFQKLRPCHVLLQRLTTLRQCLCEYCTSVLLKLKTLNRTLFLFNEKSLQIKDKYDLLDLTMCDKPSQNSRFHKLICIQRNCMECGAHLLKERFASFNEHYGEKIISWQAWETQSYFHDGKQKSKKVQVTCSEKFSVLLEKLTQETGPLASHVFTANWQGNMFTQIRNNLPINWALFVMDFAENYSCISQDEIQAAHWATQQVTVHPTVCFYNCQHGERSHIAQEALVFISDDLKHDSHLVHHFESIALQHLKNKRGIQLTRVIEFTDGCSAQYKSKTPFADISFSKHTHCIPFERHFFGSRHGKGPSDGVSGCVKSYVRRAVISRRVAITSAEDMHSFCNDNMTQNDCDRQMRSFFFVKQEDVRRDRPEIEVKTSLNGTRLLHAVRCVEPGVLDTRLLSCFCNSCLENNPNKESCCNSKYVIPWQRRALKMTNPVPTVEDSESIIEDCPETELVPCLINEEENIEEIWRKLQDSSPFTVSDLSEDSVHELVHLLDPINDTCNVADDVADTITDDVADTITDDVADDVTDDVAVDANDFSRITTGSHIKVKYGFKTYPAVVVCTPEGFDEAPADSGFYCFYYEESPTSSSEKKNLWRIDETPFFILSNEILGLLPPPNVITRGTRLLYEFCEL